MRRYSLFFIVSLFAAACQRADSDPHYKVDRVSAGVIGGMLVPESDLKAATVGVFMGTSACTGSYIGNNRVVTAAHCVHNQPRGDVRFLTKVGNFRCEVLKAIEHPEYARSRKGWYDVGVLVISCDDDRLSQVAPYRLGDADTSIDSIWAAGYGAAQKDGGFSFPNLKAIPLLPFDLNAALAGEVISDAAKRIDDLQQMSEMVKEGRFACYVASRDHTVFFGDSGGPEYVVDAIGAFTLTGVSSSVFMRAYRASGTGFGYDLDEVYMNCGIRVASYRNWILSQ